MLRTLLFTGLLSCTFLTTASARCVNSYICDGYGHCGYEDICEQPLDLPSINIPPFPALTPPREPRPFPSLAPPPLGTTHCEYLQVNGQWANICE